MFCTKCGGEIGQAVTFCTHCGARQPSADKTQALFEENVGGSGYKANAGGPSGSYNAGIGGFNSRGGMPVPPAKKKMPLYAKIIICAAVVAVVGGAAAVWMLTRDKGEPTKSPQMPQTPQSTISSSITRRPRDPESPTDSAETSGAATSAPGVSADAPEDKGAATDDSHATSPADSPAPEEPPADSPAPAMPSNSPAAGAPDTPMPSVTPAEPAITLYAGDDYEFGGYVWQVLDVQGSQALIITKNIVAMRCYNGINENCTWESSSMRKWLNSTFYNYFSNSERAKIIEAKVRNSENPWYGTYAGADTWDNVFLLSIDEAAQYFGDSGALNNGRVGSGIIDDRYNSGRQAKLLLTNAQANSWLDYIVGERSGFLDSANKWLDDYNGNPMWWWLRSPGSDSSSAAYIQDDGKLNVQGFDYINYDTVGVRPAMWISLAG